MDAHWTWSVIDLRYDLTLSSVEVSIGRPYLRARMV